MKDIKRILVFAGECVLFGAVFVGVGIGLSGSNSKETKINIELTEQEEVISQVEDLKEINISLTSEDINIIPTDRDNITIKYSDDKNDPIYEIINKNGILRIKKKDFNSVQKDIHIFDIAKHVAKKDRVFRGVSPVKIYVPKSYSGGYKINVTSGDVKLESIKSDYDVMISATSGKIILDGADTVGSVEISTVSSAIRISNLNSENQFSVNSTSGTITLDNINTAKDSDINSVSGIISCEGINSEWIDVNSVSGNVKIEKILVEKSVNVNTISGNVNLKILDESDDYSVYIETVSGNVDTKKGKDDKASKLVEIETISGSVNVDFQ